MASKTAGRGFGRSASMSYSLGGRWFSHTALSAPQAWPIALPYGSTQSLELAVGATTRPERVKAGTLLGSKSHIM